MMAPRMTPDDLNSDLQRCYESHYGASQTLCIPYTFAALGVTRGNYVGGVVRLSVGGVVRVSVGGVVRLSVGGV